MQLSVQDIAHMQKQLQELREQNYKLKQLLQAAKKNAEEEDFNMLTQSTAFLPKTKALKLEKSKCPHCMNLQTPVQKSRKQLVEEFQQWSHRLNNKFVMKKHLPQLAEEQQQQFFQTALQIASPKKFPLIEHICLYGPDETQMMSSQKNSRISHRLYMPENDEGLQLYGNYLYPEKVGFRVLRQKKKDIDIDKILFRKSFKQHDCSIFIFQSRSQIVQKQNQNPILREINPFMSLYSIGLQFTDYCYSNKPYLISSADKSVSFNGLNNDQKFEELQNQDEFNINQEIKRQKSQYGQTSVFKSSYYLCIFTYFPFVDFFSQLLIKMIDQIKIRRMENQTQNGSKYESLDIKYVVKELKNIVQQIEKCYMNLQIAENQQVELSFGSQRLYLQLEKTKIKENLMLDWAYRILRLMDKQILYDIYCLVMFQESICVLSENTFILTFCIHLLVSLLPRPFIYPHPIVSTVFQEQLLETPFTAIMGINKDTKWFQANDQVLSQKLQGKILFNLSDQEVKIKGKNKQKLPKSQKIKKIFNNFYKKVQKIDKNSKKRDFLSRQISQHQNQLVFQLFNDLQSFYKQQLLNFMPNKQIIDTMRKNMISDNLTATNAQLIRSIEQYINQSRKNKEQDPFVNTLMKKQIFGVYISQRYDLV